jgi:predicted esterase
MEALPGVEHRIEVPRSARYHALGEAGAGTREWWIVCHGYGQLARWFVRHFAPLDDGTRLIVAPEALNRFYLETDGRHGPESRVGATWMTREDRLAEIDDHVRYLDLLYARIAAPLQLDEVRVVLGFSQGVATVCRWASRSSHRIDDLVLWAAGVPPEMEIRPGLFGDARLTLVTGVDDPYAAGAALDRETARLEAGGLRHQTIRFAGGHHLDGDTLERIARACT